MKATVRIDTGNTVVEKTVSDPGVTEEYLAVKSLIQVIKAYDAITELKPKNFKYAFKAAFDAEFGDLS